MIQRLTTAEAADLLVADKNANWSYLGAKTLVEFLEEIEREAQDEYELDVVAIRCDWSEYPSAYNAAAEYGYILPDDMTPQDAETDALNWLQERTTALPFDVLDKSGVIVAAF
mgnify:FL=1